MFNTEDSSNLFWRPRLGYYSNKSKNGKLYVEDGKDGKPDPSKPLSATSYDWWEFLVKVGDRFIFNDGHYSSQTGSHQHGVKEILEKLKIKYLEIHSQASLSKPDEVLYELQETLFKAKREHAFTYTKRCKPHRWSDGGIEERRKDAAESLKQAELELGEFVKLYKFSDAKLKSNDKRIEEVDARRKRDQRAKYESDKETRRNAEKEKRKLLAESWEYPSITGPITDRPTFEVDPKGDEDVTQALQAFLNTDVSQQRIGNYFIDGNRLVYRIARHLDGKVSLRENVIAMKLVEDGRMIIVGNKATLRYLGSTVAYGRESKNYSETEIQKRLSSLVMMIDFEAFTPYNAKPIPMTLANVTVYRLTGKVGLKAA